MRFNILYVYLTDGWKGFLPFIEWTKSGVMHIQQMRFFQYDYPSHIQPIPIWPPNAHATDLEKTPVNDLNNPILLLRSHLVIGGKTTQPSPENICPYVHSRAWNIGICAASAVSLNRNERVCPVYRLHMHELWSLSDGITTICSFLSSSAVVNYYILICQLG